MCARSRILSANASFLHLAHKVQLLPLPPAGEPLRLAGEGREGTEVDGGDELTPFLGGTFVVNLPDFWA